MAKPARQHCPLAVVPRVVSDAAIQVVNDPNLQWSSDQVENQAGGECLGQPQIATLGLGGAANDDPTDGEEGNRYEEGEDGFGRGAAVRWA